MKKEKGFSLKWGLIAIVICCWVISILVIIFAFRFYFSSQIENQARNTIETSVESAIDLTIYNVRLAMDASRIASFDSTIKNAYLDYESSGNYVRLYDKVIGFLSKQYRRNRQFASTTLYFCNKPESVYYVTNASTFATYSKVTEFKQIVQPEAIKRSSEIDTSILFFSVNNVMYMMRNIVDSDFVPYAVIVMEIDAMAMFESIGSVPFLENARIKIGESEQTVFGEANMSLTHKTLPTKLEIEVVDGGKYDVSAFRKTDSQSISYYLEIDNSPIAKELGSFNKLMIALILGVIPILGLATYLYYKHLSLPINAIVCGAVKIANGELGYQLTEMPKSYELTFLVQQFNQMSESMKKQFDQSYWEQNALQDAKIKALMSQINPHFLNNTLEIINWEARMQGDVKVSTMIEALSTMLGAATARGGKSTVKLAEEMSFVDAYLYIISERMGKRIKFTKQVDPKLLGYDVPRLIMQPVVENAVEHGIEPRQRGEVEIRVSRVKNDMIIEVINDGTMTQEDVSNVNKLLCWDGKAEEANLKFKSLGIRNVNQRLKIMYGDKYGLTIENDKNGHTLASIILPIVRFTDE